MGTPGGTHPANRKSKRVYYRGGSLLMPMGPWTVPLVWAIRDVFYADNAHYPS